MLGCHRPPAPAALDARANDITESFITKRQADPRHDFRWPQDLYVIVHAALARMTDERCAYCDGDLRPATVRAELDHFQPKSRSDLAALEVVRSPRATADPPSRGALDGGGR